MLSQAFTKEKGMIIINNEVTRDVENFAKAIVTIASRSRMMKGTLLTIESSIVWKPLCLSESHRVTS